MIEYNFVPIGENLHKALVKGANMKKNEFIEYVTDKTGETSKKTTSFYEAFWKSIEEQLMKGEEVCLTGVGTFRIKKRPARKGINPQTKKQITIPAKKTIVFKPSQSFADRING